MVFFKNSGSIHTINPFYTHEKSVVQIDWTYPLFYEELIDKHARKLCTQLKNGNSFPFSLSLSLSPFLSLFPFHSLYLISNFATWNVMRWNEFKDYVGNFILTKWPTKHIPPDDRQRMHTYRTKYEIVIFLKKNLFP